MATAVSNQRADRGPIALADEDRSAIAAVAQVLADDGGDAPRLVAADGSEARLPEPLLRVVRQAVAAFSDDLAVTVMPAHRQLTTQEAANLLNMSRPHLIGLLDEGRLPYSKVGTHRRIRFADLMAFRDRDDAKRWAQLDELTRASQEMGFYDDV